MYDDYNEEEIERFGKEGGKYLLDHDIIDTADLGEVGRFKREMEEEEIEKIDNEEGLRKPFSITKLRKERSDNSMYNDYDDDRELIDEIREFYEDEEIEGLEKALKVLPEKLREVLKESFKILNEYRSEMGDIPELLSAVKLLGRLATGEPGKYPLPSKYPYPKKVKKSMDWQEVQDMLFGGHIPADDEEIEKSSRENPFPSITRALKIKEEAIEEIENEMEEDAFNPDDRRI